MVLYEMRFPGDGEEGSRDLMIIASASPPEDRAGIRGRIHRGSRMDSSPASDIGSSGRGKSNLTFCPSLHHYYVALNFDELR